MDKITFKTLQFLCLFLFFTGTSWSETNLACLFSENRVGSDAYGSIVEEGPDPAGASTCRDINSPHFGNTAYGINNHWGFCPAGSYWVNVEPWAFSSLGCGVSRRFCYIGPLDYDCDGDGVADLIDEDQNPIPVETNLGLGEGC